MKFRTIASITFFIAACMGLGNVVSADSIQWNVQTVQSAGAALLNLTDAESLLSGSIPHSVNVTGQYDTLNFDLADHPNIHGKFSGDVPFPGITTSNEKDFAVHATASIDIPAAGSYTFGVSSDDGFSMTVGSNLMQYVGQRAPAESYSTFTFSQPGTYPVDLVFFQHRYNAELEVFASPGVYTTFSAPGANFQLVSAAISGGGPILINPNGVPEPSTILLLLPCSLGLLLRRERRRPRRL